MMLERKVFRETMRIRPLVPQISRYIPHQARLGRYMAQKVGYWQLYAAAKWWVVFMSVIFYFILLFYYYYLGWRYCSRYKTAEQGKRQKRPVEGTHHFARLRLTCTFCFVQVWSWELFPWSWAGNWYAAKILFTKRSDAGRHERKMAPNISMCRLVLVRACVQGPIWHDWYDYDCSKISNVFTLHIIHTLGCKSNDSWALLDIRVSSCRYARLFIGNRAAPFFVLTLWP